MGERMLEEELDQTLIEWAEEGLGPATKENRMDDLTTTMDKWEAGCKCPECGLADVGRAGIWACAACGARGVINQRGKRTTDETDRSRLRDAQGKLVDAMAMAECPTFVKDAADLYADLHAMHLDPYNWHLIGDGHPTTTGGTPTEWLLPECAEALDELEAAAEDLVDSLADDTGD